MIAGMSGTELASRGIEESVYMFDFPDPEYSTDRSSKYWLGDYLAYYQWYTDISFRKIVQICPIGELLSMYHPFHEMDINQFVDCLEAERGHRITLLRDSSV